MKARYRSIHVDIVSDWRIEDGTFKLSITVPPATVAAVIVPGDGVIGTGARRAPAPNGGGNRSFEVAAGTHVFETPLRVIR